MSSCLFVVSTPIGNYEDITLRALRVLREVDLIAAEDTRQTGQLLAHHEIKNSLISFHEHNERQRIAMLIDKLKAGQSIAVVSDAGTPMVSDPGYHLIKTAISQNILVTPIPGVSAAICGLSVSGLPTDAFVFIGFLPRKKGKRDQQLKALANIDKTVIIYESPKRIVLLLQTLARFWGERHCVLGREMTKSYEEFIRGTLTEVGQELEKRAAVKGECTLLVAGRNEDLAVDSAAIEALLMATQDRIGGTLTSCAKDVARKLGVPKKRVYALALELIKAQETGIGDDPDDSQVG